MDDNHNVGDDDDDDGREEELYNRPKKSHKRFDLILFSSAIVKGGHSWTWGGFIIIISIPCYS